MRHFSITLAVSALIYLTIAWASGEQPHPDKNALLRELDSETSYTIQVHNDSIGVLATDWGRFSIGTVGGRALLFGYPYTARTTHTNFYVDDTIRQNISDTISDTPLPAELVQPTYRRGDTLITVWRVRDVEFTQILVPVWLGDNPQVRIEYIARNRGLTDHRVGILLFLDTYIGTNDCAPIATPLGYFESEQQFIGDVPSFWQAFEVSPFQPPDKLVGEGIIAGWDATPPDVLIYGDFWHYRNVSWDYTFIGGLYDDSAVLMRWNPVLLAPGAETRFVTYYGIGTIDRTSGEIALSLTYPNEIIPAGCDSVSPDSFVVTLFASSEDTVAGAIATLEVPDFLTILDDRTKTLSPERFGGDVIGSVSWQVIVNYPVASVEGSLRVNVSAPGYSSSRISRSIRLTAPDGAPPVVIPAYLPDTIFADSVTARFILSDESGINPAGISAAVDGHPVSVELTDSILRIHLDSLSEGPHTLTVSGIADVYGCEAEPFSGNIYVQLPPPPELRAVNPPEGSVSSCEEDTILIEVSTDVGLSVERSSLTVDGSSVPFAVSSGSVISFAETDEGVHTAHFTAVDEYGSSSEIEWTYTVDRTPPQVNSAGGLLMLRSPAEPLNFQLTDESGISSDAIGVRVATENDTSLLHAGDPGISFDGTNLTLVLSETGINFAGDTSLAIWIIAADRASLCGANEIDTLILSMRIPRTPPEIVLLEPEGISACDTVDVVMLIEDDNGINADSAWVEIADERYDLSSPDLSLLGDTLVLRTSTEHLPSGPVPIRVGGIKDLWGNELSAGTSVTITVDRTPPEITSISPSSDTLHGTESIVFECRDDISGISPERSFVVCNGETLRYGSGMGFDGVHIFVPSAFWLPTAAGTESLSVSVTIADNISECEPNTTDTTVHFVIRQSGPAAQIISPPDSIPAGCDSQQVVILIYDPDGVDESRTTIAIDGLVRSGTDDFFRWHGDSVMFEIAAEESTRIVIHAYDSLGFDSEDTFIVRFDREPPEIVLLSPTLDSELVGVPDQIQLLVRDSGAGVDWTTFSLIVNGNLFTSADASVEIHGDTVMFNPQVGGISPTEHLTCAVHAADRAFGCVNARDTSFEFSILQPSFWWELLEPQGISACGTVEVSAVFHSNFPLEFDSLRAKLGGENILLTHSGDTINALLNGQDLTSGVNTLSVWGICDTAGRITLTDTVFIPILYDAGSPTILPLYPQPGENAPAGASVVAVIRDDFSGIDKFSTVVEFNGTPTLTDTINWHGDTLVMPVPEGITGEVEVCITANDMPDQCLPHSQRLCWTFNIPGVGPTAQIIQPPEGAFTHDRSQKIVAIIRAENGLDLSMIRLRVNGREFSVGSEEISLRGDTLVFEPSSPWQDGDTVNFEISLTDEFGLTTHESSYFVCDFSPPECGSHQPDGVVMGYVDKIQVEITDRGAGVDPNSIVFQVEDLIIPFDNYAVTFDGSTAVLDIEAAGIHLNRFDSVQVCVLAADKNTGLGTPNIMEGCCFWFMMTDGGCSVSPQTITPNGDGFNDAAVFKIGVEGEVSIKIFSLSGALVAEISGEGIINWDGTDDNGKPVPGGVYIYTVEKDGKNICKGTIVVAR